jgi:hypothetical protein
MNDENEIMLMLGRIESSIKNMESFNVRTTLKFENDDNRIRCLENINNQRAGKSAVISAIFGGIGAVIIAVINAKIWK